MRPDAIDVDVSRLLARAAHPANACEGCTACCTVMAVPELRKPSRRACDHVRDDRCGAHDERPESCRAFNCLWLRGALGASVDWRPDALGVLFDGFVARESGAEHWIAFELWPRALASVEARAALEALAAHRPLLLAHRDGSFEHYEHSPRDDAP